MGLACERPGWGEQGQGQLLAPQRRCAAVVVVVVGIPRLLRRIQAGSGTLTQARKA